MAAPPGFENDMLVSYSNRDDESNRSGDEGWVSIFHKILETRVSQLLGEKVTVFNFLAFCLSIEFF